MKQLKRNPFGRYTIVRETIKYFAGDCKWCGMPAKYRYGHDNDSGGTHWLDGNFCCKGCCEAYHNTKLA